MTRRILITGGAGFIGCHLIKRLLDEDNQVICLDNFYTGRRENISDLMTRPRFSLLDRDVREPGELPAVDEIYNLACPASPIHYQKDRVVTTLTSVIGAYRMLEHASRTGARFLLTSTSEVYGDPLVSPQVESYWGT